MKNKNCAFSLWKKGRRLELPFWRGNLMRKIKKLKVVYSTEQPKELKKKILNGKKVTPGSVSFVPSVGGLIIASVVINDLLNKK